VDGIAFSRVPNVTSPSLNKTPFLYLHIPLISFASSPVLRVLRREISYGGYRSLEQNSRLFFCRFFPAICAPDRSADRGEKPTEKESRILFKRPISPVADFPPQDYPKSLPAAYPWRGIRRIGVVLRREISYGGYRSLEQNSRLFLGKTDRKRV
jgi:hypothetical protein